MPIYRRLSTGGKRVEPDHPLADLLTRQPNSWQSAFEFRQLLQQHLLLRGNAYAAIVPGVRGAVDELIHLSPDRVTVASTDEGVAYVYRDGAGADITYTQNEIFHLRGPMLDDSGLVGLSVIDFQRETIGGALAAQAYGNRFFSNDARPGVVLTHPGTLGAEPQQRLKDGWRKAHGDGGQHGVAVLEEGMDVKTLSITPEQAQFLGARKYSATDIARIFRVPPHLIGDLERATFSNIEHQGIDYVTHALRPWLVRWEQAISRQLMIAPQTFFAEHRIEGLLRGDTKTRYEGYAIARQWGWMSVNEIRSLENLNPIAGGDQFLAPLNMSDTDPAAAIPEALVAPAGPVIGSAANKAGHEPEAKGRLH